MRIGIGRVAHSYKDVGDTDILVTSSTFFVVKVTRKSVNMTAVGVFIGANVLFIIGFAILFVCQKRILSKAMLPNTGI